MKTITEGLSQEKIERASKLMKEHEASEIIVGCFGNWLINDNGDFVNIESECSHYFLFRERIIDWDEDEMYNHISKKTWFMERQPSMGIEFKKALAVAKTIIEHS